MSYGFDAGGRRTCLTLPGNLNIVYEYNAKRRLTRLTDWDSQATTMAHDHAESLLLSELSELVEVHS